MHYFETFYKGIIKSPSLRTLDKIVIAGIPSMQSYGKAGCTLFFEVYQVKGLVNELIYDNKEEPDQVKFYPKSEGVI